MICTLMMLILVNVEFTGTPEIVKGPRAIQDMVVCHDGKDPFLFVVVDKDNNPIYIVEQE